MFEYINIESNVAVYEQIENQVQFSIASGELKPGDKLPPSRELAEKLGVNTNTVAKSYRDLEVMGYVYARQGMGVFVQRNIEDLCKENCRKRIISKLHETVGEAKAAGMTLKAIREAVSKCYSSESGPYGPAPDEVLALARNGK